MVKQKIAYWVIPPEADREFVANREDVLEVYRRPYDAQRCRCSGGAGAERRDDGTSQERG
jgi:hypothetical protein